MCCGWSRALTNRCPRLPPQSWSGSHPRGAERWILKRPRQPHLNGKVERVQRTIAEEYWDGVTSLPGSAWEKGLQAYQVQGISPSLYLADAYFA